MEEEQVRSNPSGVARFIDAAKKALGEQLKPFVTDLMDRCIRIDRGRNTLSVADVVLIPGLNRLTSSLAPDALVTVEARASGFQVGATLNGKRISALLELEQLTFAGSAVSVRFRTPRGLRVENGTFAQNLAALVIRFCGGTWLGRKLLSSQLPPGVTWDGSTASATADLLNGDASSSSLARIETSALIARNGGWTSFSFDQGRVIEPLLAYLLRDLSKADS